VPAFFLVSATRLYQLAVLVPVLIFFAWNPQLFRGDGQIPKRSIALVILATACNMIWFVTGWNYGLQYQGPRYTAFVFVANILWLVVLVIAFLRFWRAPSFGGNLLFHWMLFAWLGWYAFPYLGELP
jgi:hypothetical protein